MSDPVAVRRGAEPQSHLSLPDLTTGSAPSRSAVKRYPSVAQIAELREQAQASGHEEGYQAGYAAGLEAGRQAADEERAQLQELLEQMADALSVIDQEVLERLAELAVAIARAVTGVSVRERPDQLLEVAKTGVALIAAEREPTCLYVNPQDLPLLRSWTDSAKLALVPDKSIAPGGCVIESGYSRVDASVETRLRQVTEQVLAAVPRSDRAFSSSREAPAADDETIELE